MYAVVLLQLFSKIYIYITIYYILYILYILSYTKNEWKIQQIKYKYLNKKPKEKLDGFFIHNEDMKTI